MPNPPLAQYRVLDLTGHNGWSCARILGDLGADVVKVEPPGGDPGRSLDPRYDDTSLEWLAFNANKRGITLNLESETGRNLLHRLVKQADFVVESFRPGYLDALGCGYSELAQVKALVILTSISPFGQTGPYAQYRGSDLTAMATSGFMSLVGEPERAPLRVSSPQAPLWASMYAAAGTLVAHHQRERTGRGQHVDVSMQASMLWALANAPAHWSLNRETLHRGGNFMVGRNINGARMRALYPCKDGHINFIIYGGEAGRRSNEGMVEWMAEEGMAPEWLRQKEWGAFNIATSTQAEIDAIEKPFVEFMRGRTKVEFSEESVKRGILGYPVNNASDIEGDPQLAARDFWVEVESNGGSVTLPGAFAKFSATQVSVRRRAPKVGEHNEAIFEGELGMDMEKLKRDGAI